MNHSKAEFPHHLVDKLLPVAPEEPKYDRIILTRFRSLGIDQGGLEFSDGSGPVKGACCGTGLAEAGGERSNCGGSGKVLLVLGELAAGGEEAVDRQGP